MKERAHRRQTPARRLRRWAIRINDDLHSLVRSRDSFAASCSAVRIDANNQRIVIDTNLT